VKKNQRFRILKVRVDINCFVTRLHLLLKDTHIELKQEKAACVYEHWKKIPECATGMIGPCGV